ncbi:MAG: DMT family transporter [Pseudomonadota bacterium]
MSGPALAAETGPGPRVWALTAAAMVAFAANSLLTRAALAEQAADPVSFTFLRLGAGAVCLSVLVLLRPGQASMPRATAGAKDWGMVAALLVYMVGFSLAYLSLSAGTGALILFGAVQITMLGVALAGGERPSLQGWAGIGLALAGLLVLLFPGLTAPDPLGAALMAAAGVGWGAYSLAGRGAADPLAVTARNFNRAALIFFALALGALAAGLASEPVLSVPGIVLAVLSGAVASGLGYAVWYAALPALGAGRAAVVQLSVPIIAAAGGALLLAEPPDLRLVIAAAGVLGGIFLYLRAPRTA